MTKHDPAMIESNFERREKDKYYTEPWVTHALMSFVPCHNERVWEPAAGRGDMSKVLREYTKYVISSDIDPDGEGVEEWDFFNYTGSIVRNEEIDCIITNPPYDRAQEFVEECHRLVENESINMAALLLRSEFKHAITRSHLFGNSKFYGSEIVLTKRPKWDWWYDPIPGKKRHGPRHNFSWFIWSSHNFLGEAQQHFWYEKEHRSDVGQRTSSLQGVL